MQLQSERFSNACDWNFKVEGDPFVKPLQIVDMGLTLLPGTMIESAAFNILQPLVTSGNPAVDTFIIFAITPLGPVLLNDTINNINALLLNTWYTSDYAPYIATRAFMEQNLAPIAQPGIYQIQAYSSAPMTAGRIMCNLNCVQLYVN